MNTDDNCGTVEARSPEPSAHDELRAIKRVLKLVDGYISTQNQDLLLAWDGGIMTWGELREHIQCVLKASVLNDREIE